MKKKVKGRIKGERNNSVTGSTLGTTGNSEGGPFSEGAPTAGVAPIAIEKVTRRLFIAIPIDEAIQKQIATLREEGVQAGLITEKGSRISWARLEQLHVTLIFLGETPLRLRGPIEQVIHEAAKATPPFSLTLSGLSVFPSLSKPRIIFAGIVEEASLMVLHRELAFGIEALGVQLESRPFQPHLTVGRIQTGGLSENGKRWIVEKGQVEIGDQEVTSIHLMASQLHPTGSVYTSLYACDLGKIVKGD